MRRYHAVKPPFDALTNHVSSVSQCKAVKEKLGAFWFAQAKSAFSRRPENLLLQCKLYSVFIVTCNHNVCFPAVIDLLQHVLQTPSTTIGFINRSSWPGLSLLVRRLLVIHPVCGLVVWIYGVFVTDLFGSVSLLVHVGAANQFGTKEPALPS